MHKLAVISKILQKKNIRTREKLNINEIVNKNISMK